MKILVLTLSSSEPQLAKCLESVSQQVDIQVSQKVFEGLSAHQGAIELLNYCRREAANFDAVVKLDADMVIVSEFFILRLVKLLQAGPHDRLTIAVFDHITQRYIRGLHILIGNQEFPDPSEVISGERRDDWIGSIPGPVVWTKDPALRVDHAIDFDNFQAFAFGFNRGQKAHRDGYFSPNFEALYDLISVRNTFGVNGFLAGYKEGSNRYDHPFVRERMSKWKFRNHSNFFREYYSLSGSWYRTVRITGNILLSRIIASMKLL